MCKVRQKEVVGATCLLLAVQSPTPRCLDGHRTLMLLWYDNQKQQTTKNK
jgi:hypothetical protein